MLRKLHYTRYSLSSSLTERRDSTFNRYAIGKNPLRNLSRISYFTPSALVNDHNQNDYN